MTLETGVKALAEAVAVDVKALEIGKVDSNDPRLTDSREWSEETVTKAEAEAGTASTRRAWTSQRVRQAINAWWQSVTSVFGRNLVAASNEQAARDALQLGTAATKDVGESSGNVMGVGVSRLGQNPDVQPDFDLNTTGMQHGLGLYYKDPNIGVIGSSFMSSSPAFVGTEYEWNALKAYVVFGNNSAAAAGSKLAARFELVTSGNILSTTGQSNIYPMTQKAVTDALNNNAIGVGQTWQYVTASREKGTTYTNTTGKPIAVSITTGVNSTRTLSLYVNEVLVGTTVIASSAVVTNQLFAIVPAGSTYMATLSGGATSINSWVELR